MLTSEPDALMKRCPFGTDTGIQLCAGSGCMAWREIKPEVEIRVADIAPTGWRDVTGAHLDLIETWLDRRYASPRQPASPIVPGRISQREVMRERLRVYERVLNPGGGYCARLGKPEIPSLKPEDRPHAPR